MVVIVSSSGSKIESIWRAVPRKRPGNGRIDPDAYAARLALPETTTWIAIGSSLGRVTEVGFPATHKASWEM
jgi:hypothetical protein